jgi:Leu/Phe-tRNA-protein transferase
LENQIARSQSKIDIPQQNVKVPSIFTGTPNRKRWKAKLILRGKMLQFQVIYQKNLKEVFFTVKISVTQAAVILKCCNFNRTDQQEFTNHVITKFKTDLDAN